MNKAKKSIRMPQTIHTWSDYHQKYQESIENPERFWEEIAETHFWRKKWDKTLEWKFDGDNAPEVKWFLGGKLNITENIFERNISELQNQVAIYWEPNQPDEQGTSLTYGQLFMKVKQFANALLHQGIKKGDRVAIYLPMVPELVIAMLACARIGAIHSIIFAGFSATSLSDRIIDASCNLVITADGGFRGSKTIPLKKIVDDALSDCPTVKKTIVLKRTGEEIPMQKGRDAWWHECIEGE